ncbi:MAG TPA: 4-hydroxythreonine-4-phosphate dehydrogenase PdxA [Candidatus Bathyarchaeia archaeon]|nr:4-hydroxythreonine-4-phosphate dehydrogenase PdxA [Candidatus Bathyarchaeia archaeon]
MAVAHRKTIGITLGDPCGIGPEITAKALSDPDIASQANFVLIGDKAVFQHYGKNWADSIRFDDLNEIQSYSGSKTIPIEKRGRAAYGYLQRSIELLKQNKIQGVVTAPVNKQAIIASGIRSFTGHTEMFAEAFGIKRVEMMFVGGPFKTIIATRHVPLHQVPEEISTEGLLTTIRLAHDCLANIFKIKKPRIAICGLNPHAGEGGKIGTEELTIINPAVAQAQQNHMTVEGPFAADTLFIPMNARRYDLIIAMYHDQGLAPIKALYFTQLVNYTIGLPFIRTSTAHGTAEDIVGQGIADPSSMIEAIKLACELTQPKAH